MDFSLKQAHTSLVSPAFKSSVNKLEASLIPASFPFLSFFCLFCFTAAFFLLLLEDSKQSLRRQPVLPNGAAGQLQPSTAGSCCSCIFSKKGSGMRSRVGCAVPFGLK